KTSLSDCLLATNGFITEASAAKLRFLDSRQDEQNRQITIKASVVSLLYQRRPQGPLANPRKAQQETKTDSQLPRTSGAPGGPPGAPPGGPPKECGRGAPTSSPYMINLIDCPGHVDFASEVHAGVRLSDGCLLLVDSVEGIYPQTLSALSCALKENILPLLIFTKVDKLISKLQLSPKDAYAKFQDMLEQLNAHLHQHICAEAFLAEGEAQLPVAASGGPPSSTAAAAAATAAKAQFLGPLGDPSGEFVYFDGDSANKLEFSPSRGNVLFASALHGWCFSIPSFVSKTLLSQLGLPASSFSKLCSALWGDKYIRRRKPKQQAANEDGQAAASLPDIEVRSSPFTTGQQRMAEQLLFEPIWKLYKVAAGDNASSETNFKEKTQAQSNPEEDDRLARLCGMARSLSLEGVEELEKELRRILSATRQQRAAEKSKIKEEMVGDIVAAFMAKWLPVGETLLETIVLRVPNPVAAAFQRLHRLCPSLDLSCMQKASKKPHQEHSREENFQGIPQKSSQCATQGSPPGGTPKEDLLLVYVAKFLAADISSLRLTGDTLHGLEAITGFVGLSRIFLGRLECGMTLFVCSETQDPRGAVPSLSSAGSSGGNSSRVSAQRKLNQQQYVVEGIYLLFGQDLRPVKEATAGSVVALSLVAEGAPKEAASGAPQGAFKDVVRDVTSWIQGLRASGGCLMQTENPCRYTDELDIHRRGPLAMEGALRCSTLSNDPSCPSLVSPYSKASSAIVRVAVESENLEDSQQFLLGVAQLFLADPSLELSVLDSGELLLGCCGEVHLETSLKDLEVLYARVPIRVSPPMTAIRETLAFPSEAERTDSGALSLSFSRRVPFPPWVPVWRDGGDGATAAAAAATALAADAAEDAEAADASAAGAAVAAEDKFAAWLKAHRSSNSVCIGGTPDSPITIVLKAQRMPDRVTDWLTDNATDILRVLKSRIPSGRFLRAQDSQENLQGSPEASAAALESCAVEIEAQLNRHWTEKDQGERAAAKGKAGGPEGPPGRLWGLTLSGGATTALFSASNMNVLFKEASPNDGDQEVSAGGPEKWQQEAPAVQQGGEGAPLGWISADCGSAVTLGAAKNISGPLSAQLSRLLPAVLSGFQLGSLAGPLAEEPIRGVAFTVEALAFGEGFLGASRRGPQNAPAASAAGTADPAAAAAAVSVAAAAAAADEAASVCSRESKLTGKQTTTGPLSVHSYVGSGQVISAMKEACRAAMLQRGLCRICEAMLRFTLSCDQRVIGKAYSVLARRRGKIIKEEVPEGQTSFVVFGFLPTAEAPGISQEIRSKASGHASLQLQFSHWEVLQEEPFPEACMTEQELEDEGEAALSSLATQIHARAIINSIRKSKGLPTEEKVVNDAEKQRTLSRNK
ncbi:elongation factor Tu GTP-binding domain-containing protein, putative, partial [Eimeria tenella]